MAVLSALFKAQDDISSVFDKMANSGARAVEQWETAGSTASKAFDEATGGAESTAKAMQSATSSTDNWTNAIGQYDKSAMEAIFTTEELVEAGYRTSDALVEVAKAADENVSIIEKGLQVTEDFKNTNSELEAELSKLQDAYIGVAVQYGKNSEEAQGLKKEIDQLSDAVRQNKEEFSELEKSTKDTGVTASDSINLIAQAIIAAGVAKLVNEITDSVKEMAYEFSDASAIIAKSSGATGEELDSLTDSMMNVYATAKTGNLGEIAGAVGEINTRLNVSGSELDHVTGLFLDFSRITDTNVTGSVRSVSQIMKNWNVETQNTEWLLDKIAVAGQKSGVSVDSMSNMIVQNKATLQSLGYTLEDSIALLSMFEYEGLNSSQIMMGFRTAVTGFSADGKDAAEAMQEVIEEIANMGNEAEAKSLAVATFGQRAGDELATAIRSGRFGIDDWVESIENADGTLASTAVSATTLEEEWTQATNKINAAFTGNLEPTVNNISLSFARMTGQAGDFLQENPALVAGITGVAVAGGV